MRQDVSQLNTWFGRWDTCFELTGMLFLKWNFVSVTTDSAMHYLSLASLVFFRKIEAQTISPIFKLECTDCNISNKLT